MNEVSPVTGGLPIALRRRAMITLSIAIFLAVLDSVIANIALPLIADKLAVTPSEAIWVVNAYQVTMAVSLLPMSSIGDINGHRKVYLFGLVVFTLASLACGLAQSLPVLILARIVQGIGAAGITSVNMALVRQINPHAQLGRAMGIMGLVVAVAATAGPSLASTVLAVAPWQWLFLLNVPFGLLALFLAIRSLPSRPGAGHRFDALSTTLNAVAFGLIFVGADGLGHDIHSSRSMSELGVGLAVFIVFVRRQLGLDAPMMPVDLMRLPPFAISVGTSISAYTCQTLAFLALPFYFQYVGGQSQLDTGLSMTFWPAALIFAAPLAGRLSDRHSAGLLCGAGLAVVTVGMLWLIQSSPGSHWTTVMWPMLMCGIGFGFFQSSNNREFMTSAPAERSGACAGMMSTSRLIGQTVGGLIVTIIFALSGAERDAVEHGARLSMKIGIGFAIAAMLVSFGRLRRR